MIENIVISIIDICDIVFHNKLSNILILNGIQGNEYKLTNGILKREVAGCCAAARIVDILQEY